MNAVPRLRRAGLVLLALGAAGFARADSVHIVLHLPAGVSFQSFGNTADATEIKLSANALAIGFPAVPVGTQIQGAGDSCVIRIPAVAGRVPGFQLLSTASGSVVIEITADAGASTPANPLPSPGPVAPAPSNPTPPANIAHHDRPEPPPSPNPGVENPQPNPQPNPASPPGPVAGNPAPNPPAGLPGALDLIGALPKLFPDAGPIGYDPIAKADYALPESTAATAIGAGNTLIRPSTPREVVTSLLTNFDQDDKLQTGFSLAITPYPLLRREPITADDYDHPGTRFLTNLQLSLAGRPDDTIVTAGAKAARFSAGLSMIFFDDGDLRLNRPLLARIASALHQDKPFTNDQFTNHAFLPAPIPAEKLADAKKLWDDAKAKNWNAASAGLGVAPAFLSLTSKLSDAKEDGVMVWTSYSHPGPGSLSDSTQIIFGGNGRFHQRVQHNAAWARSDVYDFGAQLRYGAPDFNFFAQAQYRRHTFSNDEQKAQFVYELGLEKRVAQGVWLNLAWTNDDAVTGGSMVRSGVRFGFGDKAVLANPP